ncbi:hypothetical protein [Buttiauxella gaviniae]|uniref:hypothetical protein n=1 Tax=Buttiauxella gaviniae TaxID=82990 RepID=UPI0039AF7E99
MQIHSRMKLPLWAPVEFVREPVGWPGNAVRTNDRTTASEKLRPHAIVSTGQLVGDRYNYMSSSLLYLLSQGSCQASPDLKTGENPLDDISLFSLCFLSVFSKFAGRCSGQNTEKLKYRYRGEDGLGPGVDLERNMRDEDM